MFATENGSLMAIEYLIKEGAHVGIVDDQNRNCIHLACQGGHDEVLPFILQVVLLN